MAQERLGNLLPRYSLLLNPYRRECLTRCPRCEQQTHRRKFALLIGIEGFGTMMLGKTCRFCPVCELLVVHQDELENELAVALQTRDLSAIGNEYMVLGTVDREAWRKGLKGRAGEIGNVLDHIAEFKEELELESGGWHRPS